MIRKFTYGVLLALSIFILGSLAIWSKYIWTCNTFRYWHPDNTEERQKIDSRCAVWDVVDKVLGHPDRKYNIFH